MTMEEKQILLKDLCARLPYGVNMHIKYCDLQGDGELASKDVKLTTGNICYCFDNGHWVDFKPYLRPLSSMTEEEAITIFKIIYGDDTEFSSVEISDNCIEIWDYDYNEDGFSEKNVYTIYFEEIVRSMQVLDYLLSRHFDIPRWDENENTYKTMIEMDLALPAPEGMYDDYKL